MRDLTVRSREDEQMDAADLDPAVYACVLDDLSRVNRWTFTAGPTLRYLKRAVGQRRSFRLLDVGFGHGDMLRAIGRWAKARGIDAELVGIDLNPMSARIAAPATPQDLKIDFRTGDYCDQPEPFDFIVSAQVAHHMSDAQLSAFLQHMETAARRGWLISDLNRTAFSYLGFPLLARLMGVHRIVREDGALSIARSLKPEEWPSVLAGAGISADMVTIARRFPFRVTVERLRS